MNIIPIIMQTYNRISYTMEVISSFHNHLFYPFELIVIDNGSTDGTQEYLKLMKDIGHVHHLVLNGENKGIAKPKQQGIEIAKEIAKKKDVKYVVITDNDIVVPFIRDNNACVLTKMVQIMDGHPEIGMMGIDLNRDNAPNYQEWWWRLRQHPLDNPEFAEIAIGFWFSITRLEYFNEYSFETAHTSLYGRVDESYRNFCYQEKHKKIGLLKGVSMKDRKGKHVETVPKVGIHLGWSEDLGNEYSNFKKLERDKANKIWADTGKKW